MVADNSLMLVLAVTLGAFGVPLVLGRSGVPGAVGEVAYGAVLAAILGHAVHGGIVGMLAELGFLVLMFSAGAEIDVNRLERRRPWQLWLAVVVVLGTFVTAALGSLLVGEDVVFALLGAALSIGVAAAVLRELRLSGTPVGQAVLVIGGFGELVTILVLTVFSIQASNGGFLVLAIGLGKLAILLAASILTAVLLRTLVWWFPHHFARIVESQDPNEAGLRAAFALLFLAAAAAHLLGLEPFLAAFLAGLVVAAVFRQRDTLEAKVGAAGYGFFIPAFFIGVGLELHVEPSAIASQAQRLLLLAVIALSARLVPSLLLRFDGLSWREAVGVGLLLSAPLTLLVAIARVARDLGAMDDAAVTGIVLYALVSGMLYPILARRVLRGDAPSAQQAEPVRRQVA